jgi:DNA-binding NtrC family response regulator
MAEPVRFGGMVSQSASMRALFSTLETVATRNATVLLEGESGTGKEAAAQAIHGASARRDGPFVVVDCGAIPAQLLESELFGAERGAFTGAVERRTGAFEAAAGGTIFLDEIGELPLELQPKILRVLDQRKTRRIGSTTYYPLDLRIIAATNRSARADVEAKRLRADLYYRLAVVRIKLPPLRERLEDLPLLVDHFIGSPTARTAPIAEAMRSPEFYEKLRRYSWPGNVRELRNYVERCVALGDPDLSPEASTPTAPAAAQEPAAPPASELHLDEPLRIARQRWLPRFEREYLERLLTRHKNNVSAAARAAEIGRNYFYRLLWKYGLRSQNSPSPAVDSEEQGRDDDEPGED